MEEKQNRENWIAELNNGRYIVVDKTTGITIYDAQGYGFKNASKCWNWIDPRYPILKGKQGVSEIEREL